MLRDCCSVGLRAVVVAPQCTTNSQCTSLSLASRKLVVVEGHGSSHHHIHKLNYSSIPMLL